MYSAMENQDIILSKPKRLSLCMGYTHLPFQRLLTFA